MVMVANKKSQAQMTEDLSLFLSTNTEKFTLWLNGLLDKLQTLGTDKQKSQELEKSENESMSQQHVVKKKKTPEKADKSIADKAVTKDKNTTKVTKSFAAKIHKTIKDAKKAKGEEEYVPLLLDKSETDEFSEEFKPEEIKGIKKISEPPTPGTGQVKTTPPKVSPPTTKTSPSSTGSAEVKSAVKSPVDTTYVRSVMVKPSVSKRLGSVHSRIGQVPKAMAVPVKQSASESQRQVSPAKRKQPMSVVGNIKRKFTAFEEEEEYDPYNPAVGSVASVIRVSDRKSSVPMGLQANKSLLVRAVSAAEKSVSSKMQQILQERKMYSEKESATVQPFQRGNRPSTGDSTSLTCNNPGLVTKARTGVQKHVNRGVAGQVGKVSVGVKGRVGVRPAPRQGEAHMDMVTPMTVTLSSGMKPKANLQLVSQAPREDRMFKDLRYTIANDVEKIKKEPEVARIYPVMDSRRVQCVPIQDEAGEYSEDKEVISINSEEEVDVEEDMTKDGMTSEDEVEEECESNPEATVDESLEENGNITVINNTEIQQVDEENDDLDLIKQEVEEVEYPVQPVGRRQLDQRRFIQQRIKAEAASNTKFIVTLDGVDHANYEIAMSRPDEETEMVIQDIQVADQSMSQQAIDMGHQSMTQQSMGMEQQVSPTYSNTYKQKLVTHPQVNLVEMKKPDLAPPTIGPISINLRDTDDEEEMEAEDEEEMEAEEDSPLKKAKMMERCRFWPACVNGNACTYHHPTVPCKMFPQCKFGERCLFIHPNCKFDAKCTRKDCPYTHASKRGPVATTVIQKIVPVAIPTPRPAPIRPPYMPKMSSTSSSVTCRFYPNCSNMSCPFPHPTPCRFGMSCMKKGQCSFYHPALPTKDKLKWTASKTPGDTSERRFDSPLVAKPMPTKIT